MKILLLNHNIQNFGTNIRVFNFAKNLVNLGHNVVLLASSPFPGLKIKKKNQNGVEVICFPDLFSTRIKNGGLGPVDTFLRCLYVLDKEFDIVQNFDHRPAVLYPALISKFYSKRPLVSEWTDLHGTGGSLGNRNKLVQKIIGPYENFTELNSKKICDKLVVISRWLKEKAISIGVPRSKISYIPGGADVDNILPISICEARKFLGLPVNQKIIAYTAGTHYDAHLFLKTISIVQNKNKDVLLITTGAKFGKKLVKEGCDLNRIIEFGFLPYEKYVMLLPAVDFFVFPFTNRILNKGRWPNKIGDYMAAGRPTISNPTGDLIDLFEKHQIGLLADENPNSFASKIIELLNNPELAKNLGLNARKTAETHYSWSILTKKLEICYKTLV